MNCIICMTEQPDGNEHVIPMSLGGSFTITRVCRSCDNRLGDIADRGFVQHNESVQRRIALQLKGHNGTIPDPRKGALKRPIATAVDPDHRVRVTVNAETEELDAHVEPFIEVKVWSDKDRGTMVAIGRVFIDERDANNAEMYLRSALRKQGVRDEALLQRVCDEFLPTLVTRDGPSVIEVPIVQNLGGHHLGIAKIAYEMSHSWLGDCWLTDDVAKTMRTALRGEKSSEGQFRVFERGEDGIPSAGYDPSRTHVLLLQRVGGSYLVNIRLLDAFSAYYVVSNAADTYQVPDSRAVVMDVLTKRFYRLAVRYSDEPGPLTIV